MGTLSATLSRK